MGTCDASNAQLTDLSGLFANIEEPDWRRYLG